MGSYGNTARFDRLTGQKMKSGLVFLGWDQGRTWGSPYSFYILMHGGTAQAMTARLRSIGLGTKSRSRSAYRRFITPLSR
jgi:hypothetical protein